MRNGSVRLIPTRERDVVDASVVVAATGMSGGMLVARKVLGGSLDQVGAALERWTELRLQNVGRVIDKAAAKLPDEAAGEIHPRVAISVLEQASWCDDELMAEYLGGVMAGSHTSDGTDDRGVTFSSLIPRLSTVQVKTHYLFYRAIRETFLGTDMPLSTKQTLARIFVSAASYARNLNLVTIDEVSETGVHSLSGLGREGLLTAWGLGDHEALELPESVPPEIKFGLRGTPTHAGVELFLWAHGVRSADSKLFLDPDANLVMAQPVQFSLKGIFPFVPVAEEA